MYTYIKDGADKIFSIILIIIMSPIMLVVALAIKIEDSKHSILFKQERPGKDEKIFTIYKFRTMRVSEEDEQGNALSDMERLTRIGKFLRKTSVDELPQLFNVLKGDMSFIGPRPLLIQYIEHYDSQQRRRHIVKPGITGLAQVNGRNAISWEEKFELDIWYVDHISIILDLKILLKTIVNVIKTKDINNSDNSTMHFFGA